MENQDKQPAQSKTQLHPSVMALHAHAQAEVSPKIPDGVNVDSNDHVANPPASPAYQTASNTGTASPICKNQDVSLDDFDPDTVDWDNLDLTGIPMEYGCMENEQANVGDIIVPDSSRTGAIHQQNENPFGIQDEVGRIGSVPEFDLHAAREAAIRGNRQEITQPVPQGGQQLHASAGHLQVQPPSVLQPAEHSAGQRELLFKPTFQQLGYYQAQLTDNPVQQSAQYPMKHPQHLVQQPRIPVQQHLTQQPVEPTFQQRPHPQPTSRIGGPARHQPVQPVIAPAPQPPTNITSHAEAQQAAATRPIPHDWQPPRNDNTFPHDQAAENFYLGQLITAFTSTAHCLNKEKSEHFTARWEHISTGHSIYTPQQVETVCRQLLSIAINLHTHGPSALNVLDTVKLKNVWKTREMTFAQRIAEMCELLRLSKARCETLMGWEGMYMVVGTPGLLGVQTRRNKENNEGRQRDLEIGREAEMRKWRGERGE
jgi:hypothetical protein